MSSTQSRSAFFYGTLMHPKILTRVIGNDGSHLRICPAILLDYTRHQIKNADYPGIIPLSKGQVLFDRELDPEEKSVRGSLVTGLTPADIELLDIFEGPEYSRENASIHPLGPLTSLDYVSLFQVTSSTIPTKLPKLPPLSELSAPIEAETYVYQQISDLVATLWSFEDFVKYNAWKWVGSGSQGNKDYTEVDRRNRANGSPLPEL